MSYKEGSYYKNRELSVTRSSNEERLVCFHNDNKFDPKRVGIITSSNLHKIITITEDKMTKTAETYLKTIVAQTMLVEDQDIIEYQCWEKGKSFAMRRGNEMEAEAIEYIGKNVIPDHTIEVDVNRSIIQTQELKFGATPDGNILKDGKLEGLLEVKCPDNITIHMDRLWSGVPKEYYWQCIGQLVAVPSAEYVMFVSYHPDIKTQYRTISHYIVRDRAQKDIEKAINAIRIGNIYINKFKDDIINFST